MADTEPLAGWEREVADKQAASVRADSALQTGRAILDAYDRAILHIDARYLAETLRMVLDALRTD
jgi:hypothetical protein